VDNSIKETHFHRSVPQRNYRVKVFYQKKMRIEYLPFVVKNPFEKGLKRGKAISVAVVTKLFSKQVFLECLGSMQK